MASLPETETVQLSPSTMIALVTRLTLESWAMMGKPLPNYRRDEMPGRLLRLGDVDGPSGR